MNLRFGFFEKLQQTKRNVTGVRNPHHICHRRNEKGKPGFITSRSICCLVCLQRNKHMLPFHTKPLKVKLDVRDRLLVVKRKNLLENFTKKAKA